MTESYIIMESYFSGDATEWLNQIPESVIDKAIQILEINPNEYMKPTGYCPIDNDKFKYTVKTCLWKDLVQAVHRWGIPSPTEMQTSPSELKKHAKNLKAPLFEAIETLESLKYEALYKTGSLSKEFKVGYGIRQTSELIRINSEGGRSPFITPLDIKQAHENSGEWGNHYPIDNDIESSINALKKITQSIDMLLNDPIYKPSSQGKRKKGKEDHDMLIWSLCYIYKKYSGKQPMSWNTGTEAINAGNFTGNIIPFLRILLPYTSYNGKKTPGALQKKILRIRDRKKHKNIWT